MQLDDISRRKEAFEVDNIRDSPSSCLLHHIINYYYIDVKGSKMFANMADAETKALLNIFFDVHSVSLGVCPCHPHSYSCCC